MAKRRRKKDPGRVLEKLVNVYNDAIANHVNSVGKEHEIWGEVLGRLEESMGLIDNYYRLT